ncbi:MAG TPA: hypothetical protein VGI56_04320 [Galbitalea sp.]
MSLAVGAGAIGFALPAAAAPTTGFSAEITNLPVLDDATDITLAGTKPTTSTITAVRLHNGGFTIDATDDCGQSESGPLAFDCDFPTSQLEVLEDGQSSVEIDVTAGDGTQTHNVVSFDVLADDGSQSSPGIVPDGATGYALRTYQFVPGGVVVTGTPSSEASYVGFDLEEFGEGWYDLSNCPTGAEDIDVWAEIPAGQHACTYNYDSYSYSPTVPLDGYFRVESLEGIGLVETSDAANVANEGFAVFDAPVETTVVPNADHSVTVSGTDSISLWGASGAGNADVWVYDGNSKVVCKTVNVDTNWTCKTGPLGVGSHTLHAVTIDRGAGTTDVFGNDTNYITGGMSDFSNSHVVTFAPAPPVTTTTTTTDDTWSFTLDGIDPNNVHPGDTFTVDGTGAPAGVNLDTVIHSDPVDLGSTTSAADGTFSLSATIPLDTPPGDHHIEVTASGPGITTTTKSLAITVVPAAAPAGSGTTTTKPTKAVGTSAQSEHTAPAKLEPNILTKALTPIKEVVVHPTKIVSAFEIGLVLLLLAVLPAHLLNATLSEQAERFERRFGRRRRAPRWIEAVLGWFGRAPVVGGILVTVATAILFGFADPTFGPTLASLRLVLACSIALFFVGYVANALTGAIARAAWHIDVAVRTRPWGLILTIVAVIVSRLLHFSPGFLIGLILGLAIEGRSAAGFAWRVVVVRTSIVLAMGILAWIGYSTLTLGASEGGTFWSALLVETLVAITTEGIVALMVELLPLRSLEGERVYAHSKLLWGFLYLVTVVVFVLAVVPWEGNWDALGGALWVWVAVLAVFAALCVSVYIYFRRFAPPLEEEGGEGAQVGASVDIEV